MVYAEADPTYDIEFIDAADKTTLMAAISFGISVQFSKVYTEGITQLTGRISVMLRNGYRIKLDYQRVEKGINTCASHINSGAAINANVGRISHRSQRGCCRRNALLRCRSGGRTDGQSVIADLADVTRMQTADPMHRVPTCHSSRIYVGYTGDTDEDVETS